MLGKIASKQNNAQVTLENVPGNIVYTSYFGGPPVNNLNRTIYHLHKDSPGLPFKANQSFYMVIKNPDFDTIVFYGFYAEEIEDYMGPESNWRSDLLNLINKKFGCDAKRIIVI
jgi:hypothetical protein